MHIHALTKLAQSCPVMHTRDNHAPPSTDHMYTISALMPAWPYTYVHALLNTVSLHFTYFPVLWYVKFKLL
jgi:hypothetical protein